MDNNNRIIEQFSVPKIETIKNSPFRCLHNKNIQKNTHQMYAFLKAISSIPTGGIILADEVGLGKTIEAGLVLKYLLKQKKQNILIATPAALRVQWQLELQEKFQIPSEVIDGIRISDKDCRRWLRSFFDKSGEPHVIILSYRLASRFLKHQDFANIKWDLVVIDEAHNMRNVFKGTKTAKNLFDSTHKIPKLLLTATPLQNSLDDLYGLVSFIDPRIFESEKVFNSRFIKNQQYDELKNELRPIMVRTLRKEVAKEMKFAKRTCITMDFELSQDEKILYELVDKYAKTAEYGFPGQNKNLCILVVRKLLASSSFALIETFEKIKTRLKKLKEGTKEQSAEVGLKDFFNFLDADEQEDWDDNYNEELNIFNQKLDYEIQQVNNVIEIASKISFNTKMKKLIEGVNVALELQREKAIKEKVVIFTESLRTQKYIFDSLIESGYVEEEIVIFNGNPSDKHSKQIFNAWQAKHYKDTNPRSVQFKHAMVDYFEHNGKIFISTDSGAEGLNLQFSNTIINYDLPWNPQRIEQRIGRVHRYGQENDVVAMNFLNTGNEADKRVYEILSKKFQLFEGVFGASDEALGLLSTDLNFEKKVLEIYQNCTTRADYIKQFEKLSKGIDAKRNKAGTSLKQILSVTSAEEKNKEFKKARNEYIKYCDEIIKWVDYTKMEIGRPKSRYLKIDNNPFEVIGLNHGYLFVGGLMNNTRYITADLMFTDENGGIITVPEKDALTVLELIPDVDLKDYNPTATEENIMRNIYSIVANGAEYQYEKQTQKIRDYNALKVDNWVENKKELLNIEMQDLKERIEENKEASKLITNFQEKVDFLRSAVKALETKLQNMQDDYMNNIAEIEKEAIKTKHEFDKQFEVKLLFDPRLVVKF